MIFFRPDHNETPEGLHRAAQQTVGQLGLYRESRIRMIVRIVGANVVNSRVNNAMLEVEIEVLAAYCAREIPLPASGERFTVSCAASGWGHVWSIELLNASTVEDAIPEAEKRMGEAPLSWQR